MTNSTTGTTASAAANGALPTQSAAVPGTGASSEPKKGKLSAFRGLMPFLKPYRVRFVLAGIALVVAACATLAIPYLNYSQSIRSSMS